MASNGKTEIHCDLCGVPMLTMDKNTLDFRRANGDSVKFTLCESCAEELQRSLE